LNHAGSTLGFLGGILIREGDEVHIDGLLETPRLSRANVAEATRASTPKVTPYLDNARTHEEHILCGASVGNYLAPTRPTAAYATTELARASRSPASQIVEQLATLRALLAYDEEAQPTQSPNNSTCIGDLCGLRLGKLQEGWGIHYEVCHVFTWMLRWFRVRNYKLTGAIKWGSITL
jgi:hypothetical protein